MNNKLDVTLEKRIQNCDDNYVDLAEIITNGRLTEPNTLPEGFRLRDAVKEMKRLGRPLTDEEAKAFENNINNERRKS